MEAIELLQQRLGSREKAQIITVDKLPHRADEGGMSGACDCCDCADCSCDCVN